MIDTVFLTPEVFYAVIVLLFGRFAYTWVYDQTEANMAEVGTDRSKSALTGVRTGFCDAAKVATNPSTVLNLVFTLTLIHYGPDLLSCLAKVVEREQKAAQAGTL
jgi:hypothetical protein